MYVLLCCAVLYCVVLYYAVLCYAVLCCTCYTVLCCAVLCCVVLCCTVLYCAVLCCTVLYCAVLCCTELYCTVLYCAVLCCAVLYCAVLCCAVLYCAVLYCTVLFTLAEVGRRVFVLFLSYQYMCIHIYMCWTYGTIAANRPESGGTVPNVYSCPASVPKSSNYNYTIYIIGRNRARRVHATPINNYIPNIHKLYTDSVP